MINPTPYPIARLTLRVPYFEQVRRYAYDSVFRISNPLHHMFRHWCVRSGGKCYHLVRSIRPRAGGAGSAGGAVRSVRSVPCVPCDARNASVSAVSTVHGMDPIGSRFSTCFVLHLIPVGLHPQSVCDTSFRSQFSDSQKRLFGNIRNGR